MSVNPGSLGAKTRLDSWKEIAAFFGRDERTVKRWEKERGLPVYRMPGSARGGVFAYAEELTQWMDGAERSGAEAAPQPAPAALVNPATSQAAAQGSTSADRLLAPVPPLSSRGWSRFLPWLVPVLIVSTVAIIFSAGHHATSLKQTLAAAHVPSAEAQDLYLKGRYHWNKRNPDDLNKAVDYFTQAIVRDPSYAQAYVGLADCYNLLREFSVMPATEAYPRARAAAEKAVELNPSAADAHSSLGFALFWGYADVAGAEREFKRALELEPDNTRAHHWYATFLAEIARFPEALEEIERSRRLDPSSTPIMADKGFILAVGGQLDAGEALLKQIDAADPTFLSAHQYLSWIYRDQGRYSLYFDEEETAARLQHDAKAESDVAADRQIFAAGGYPAVLQARLKRDQKLYEHGQASDFTLAADYAQLGEKQPALQHLEKAYAQHDLNLCTLLINGGLRQLHDEPEFRSLAAKVGLPEVR
jgi:tetratricopeptide (TPR) repeat protein